MVLFYFFSLIIAGFCLFFKMELTFFNCASNLLHSSFFCSMAISKDLSLESLFSPADANEDACSLRSIKLD